MTPARLWKPLAIIAALVGLTLLFLPITSRPITWDELLYMGRAFAPEPDARILGRYAHIYVLSLFMWLFRDPYLGVQVWWSLAMAATLVALFAATAGMTLARRICVLTTTAFLLLGIDTISWGFGIAYVDHSLMMLTTLSVALLFPTITKRAEFAWWQALLLGLLFVASIRTKEVGLALVVLPLALFTTTDGALRVRGRSFALSLCWLAGAAGAFAVLLLLDAWMLGDWKFYLRRENWELLKKFNMISGYTSPYSWMSWLLRPESFTAFLIYLLTLVPVAALQRNARLTIVMLVPLAYIAIFLANAVTGNGLVVPRYSVVFLPSVCLFAANNLSLLLAATRAKPAPSATTADPTQKQPAGEQWIGAALAVAFIALLAVRDRLEPVRLADYRILHELVLPAAIVICFSLLALVLSGPRWARAPGAIAAMMIVLATNVHPMLRVVQSAMGRELRHVGETRFADLNQLSTQIRIEPTTKLAFDADLENREFFNRDWMQLRSVIGMNIRRPIRPDQLSFIENFANRSPGELAEAGEFLFTTPARAAATREALTAVADVSVSNGATGWMAVVEVRPKPGGLATTQATSATPAKSATSQPLPTTATTSQPR